jgi:hypothetical protein
MTRRDVLFLSLGAALALDLQWPQTLAVFGGAALLGTGMLAFCDWLDRIVRRGGPPHD